MSLGQDTEFFLIDSRDDSFIPAHEHFPPVTKALPVGYADKVFRDGFAVEVNTYASVCRAQIWNSLADALKSAREKLKLPSYIKFSTRPVVRLDLATKPTWPEDVTALGCSPTIDAYTGEQKVIHTDPPFRTSGAHLHISDMSLPWMNELPNHLLFIKFCDLFIGLPETILFGDDLHFQRRTLYGQAGEFRVQNYGSGYRGLEYRVCSSRIYNHPAVQSLFFKILRDVCWRNFYSIKEKWNPKIEDSLREAINTGKGALDLLDEFMRLLPQADREYRNGGLSAGYGDRKNDKNYHSRINPGQPPRPFHPETLLRLKEKLKEYTENGLEGKYEEAHYGWNEYANDWELGPEGPKEEAPVKEVDRA